MRVTTRLRYGLLAIVEIGRQFGWDPVKRKTIVMKRNIPDSYLENILIALKKRGFIHTVRGSKGGYLLTRSPKEINVLHIFEALEGPMLTSETTGHNALPCPTEMVWDRLRRAQEETLSGITIQDILDSERTEPVLDFCI